MRKKKISESIKYKTKPNNKAKLSLFLTFDNLKTLVFTIGCPAPLASFSNLLLLTDDLAFKILFHVFFDKKATTEHI